MGRQGRVQSVRDHGEGVELLEEEEPSPGDTGFEMEERLSPCGVQAATPETGVAPTATSVNVST